MNFLDTPVLGLKIIEPDLFRDERGFFLEVYNKQQFIAAGVDQDFIQSNHSRSRQGVLRGLHYQIRQPQGKLLRVLTGEIFDVAVDIRKSSATFGKWHGVILSAQNRLQFWLPPGFAHGFYVLSEWADVEYMTTDYYAPQWERTILWSDPVLGIHWPLISGQPPLISSKDAAGMPFELAEVYND